MPTRGSRFVGLNSISITRVFGGVWLEQESSIEQAATRRINHRGHREARSGFRFSIKVLCVPPCPLWLDIRDLPQDCSTLCASSRRNISRPPMPGLISEQGKGYGLLGLAGNAEVIRVVEVESQA